jgi:hypothetical protein
MGFAGAGGKRATAVRLKKLTVLNALWGRIGTGGRDVIKEDGGVLLGNSASPGLASRKRCARSWD